MGCELRVERRAFLFLAWSQSFPPALRSCPAEQSGNVLGSLSLVEINPCACEVVQITAEPKARASALECLRLSRRACVVVVRPFLPGGRVRPKAKDRQFACDQHFRDDLLILTPLKVRARMNGVPACPARRSDHRMRWT